MFAVVFFTTDKSVDIVNKKKLRPVDTTCSSWSLGAYTKVQYRTEDIDESGREIKSIKDFDGIIVFLGNARGEADAFADEYRERLRDIFQSTGDNGVVRFAQENQLDADDSKRRRKKTTKFQEFEDDIRGIRPTAQQTNSKNDREVEDRPTSDSPVGDVEKKTPKKSKGNRYSQKPPSATTKEKQKSSECQKLQSLEYFKKKKAVMENPVQTPLSPMDTAGWDSSPPKTPDMMCISLPGPVLRSSTKKRRLLLLEDQENNSGPYNIQQRQLFQFDNVSTSGAIGQSLDILNGCFNFGCRQKIEALEQDAIGYRYQISALEAENKELHQKIRKQDATMSGKDLTLLNDLKMLVEEWEGKCSQEKGTYTSIGNQQQPVTPPSCSRLPVFEKKTLSTEKLCHVSEETVCAIERANDENEFSRFFEPGDGKVLLSEGHPLYISETKLAMIRKKAMKSDSRMTRCLLDYYFTPKYLAGHSATGEKSAKPALPGKIILAIKAYLNQAFRTTDSVVNSFINRKCLDSKRYL